MRAIKLILTAAALTGGLMATSASAMPVATMPADNVSNIEHVRWVCGPYGRCWWRPNYYGYGAYGYAPGYYRGWGYRRGWRRW